MWYFCCSCCCCCCLYFFFSAFSFWLGSVRFFLNRWCCLPACLLYTSVHNTFLRGRNMCCERYTYKSLAHPSQSKIEWQRDREKHTHTQMIEWECFTKNGMRQRTIFCLARYFHTQKYPLHAYSYTQCLHIHTYVILVTLCGWTFDTQALLYVSPNNHLSHSLHICRSSPNRNITTYCALLCILLLY